MGSIPPEWQDLLDEINQRIATCHQRVACSRCGAPVGQRCCALPGGYHSPTRRQVKHPHEERVRDDGISLR